MIPEYLQAWQAAHKEDGKLLVVIVCRRHSVPVGEVRESSQGPVLVVRHRLLPENQWIRDKVALRAKGHNQRRVKPMIGWDGYLFEHPDRPPQPKVRCSGCGTRAVDAVAILDLVEEARRSGIASKHVVDLAEALR